MRHDDVDQLGRHLVDIERAADAPDRAVDHQVPHHGRVKEPLLHWGRDAHDHLRGQFRIG
jgi:hypothetical protein